MADRSLWSCPRFSILAGVSRTDFCFSRVVVCRLLSFPFYSILPFYGIPPMLDLLWSFPSGLGECSPPPQQSGQEDWQYDPLRYAVYFYSLRRLLSRISKFTIILSYSLSGAVGTKSLARLLPFVFGNLHILCT